MCPACDVTQGFLSSHYSGGLWFAVYCTIMYRGKFIQSSVKKCDKEFEVSIHQSHPFCMACWYVTLVTLSHVMKPWSQ